MQHEIRSIISRHHLNFVRLIEAKVKESDILNINSLFYQNPGWITLMLDTATLPEYGFVAIQ